MSELVIIHRAHAQTTLSSLSNAEATQQDLSVFNIWQTCRRQIFFSDESRWNGQWAYNHDDVFVGLEAEEFLIEVLCGLKSPLVGETEVFGQFKNWWQALEDQDFKNKFSPRVQNIFSVVKKIREETLYRLGSQSYGSLLRKILNESEGGRRVDFIGAGQLTREILPWVQKKSEYRIWCREPEKVMRELSEFKTDWICALDEKSEFASDIVIAAPLGHDEVIRLIRSKNIDFSQIRVFDFRHDSMSFKERDFFAEYYDLDHFSTQVKEQKQDIQNSLKSAYGRIQAWKQQEQGRIQVRPFGWDDL